MSKYELILKDCVRRKDGTTTKVYEERKIYEGELEDVKKRIESDYFVDGDVIDDGNGTKIDIYGEHGREIWTLVRQVRDGEYRAILRLYEI